MDDPQPLRRTGLGRRVADIVGGPDAADPGGRDPGGRNRDRAPGRPAGLWSGPSVVPLDVVPFAMVITDGTAGALATNRRWTGLTGLAGADSLGSGWLSVLGPDHRAHLLARIREVACGAATRNLTLPWRGPGGGRATWWLAGHDGAGGRLVGVAVARDIHVGAAGPDLPGAWIASRADDAEALASEWRALLRSAAALLSVLDAVAEWLAPPAPVPA